MSNVRRQRSILPRQKVRGSLNGAIDVPKGQTISDVERSLRETFDTYNASIELLQATSVPKPEEYKRLLNEIQGGVTLIEHDLNQIEETICIVETDPLKYANIRPTELQSRKRFVEDTRQDLNVGASREVSIVSHSRSTFGMPFR